MVLERLGVHDDIVDVNVGVVNHVGKRHVHGSLEGSRGIGDVKRVWKAVFGSSPFRIRI